MKSVVIALHLASLALPTVFFVACFGTLWLGFGLSIAESAHGAFFFGIRSIISIAFAIGAVITGLSYLAPKKTRWLAALLLTLTGVSAFCGYAMAQGLMYI